MGIQKGSRMAGKEGGGLRHGVISKMSLQIIQRHYIAWTMAIMGIQGRRTKKTKLARHTIESEISELGDCVHSACCVTGFEDSRTSMPEA